MGRILCIYHNLRVIDLAGNQVQKGGHTEHRILGLYSQALVVIHFSVAFRMGLALVMYIPRPITSAYIGNKRYEL